ncbi:origin recognition complex subunit 5-like isoform X1 [Macrosteles quadrilineatus]|uniref:origin recognition complex subunit 5-like isoform X1 n=2 Tax=Macrosteles quadrilineatus TaxID=74068 RepID=UPI0023E343F3|nr:origin recognition complex subunit 5-like isoform X1 [Macrosteles quadrilineatus]XP_054278910.1 origin recognition complex subunit 5-like isoform X1 [Macrosteles quadrilineatus]
MSSKQMDCDDFEEEDDEMIMALETIETLNQMYPGRQKQIELLYNLLGTAGDPLPECIYIYGDTATGKTQVVQALLNLASLQFAFVNCIECYTPRLLLEPILDGLLDGEYTKESGNEKCDNMMVLVKQLKIAAHKQRLRDKSCVIVLDNCERLFDLGDHYFQAFQKLQELTNMPHLCVIFISQILPEKHTTFVPHLRVFFPQYTKDDAMKILMTVSPEADDEKELFNQFSRLFLDIFYLATRDLNELKHQLVALYPKYVEPIKSGSVSPTDHVALYKQVLPHIRASLSNVYLTGVSGNEENLKPDKVLSTKVVQSLDLPYYAKYFLIAAFLASYNLPKDDKRLFVKNHGKKKKRLVQDQKKENTSKELLGPKVFTLDRLLAIFYAIMEEKTPLNANLLAQITSLVELRLLVKLGDDLDKPKYRCAVGIECVEAISRTLDFNVRKYMVH